MRIAFESSSITNQNPTGIAGYARALITELAEINNGEHSLSLLNKFSRLKRKNSMYRHPSLPAHFYLPYFSALKHNADILHALDAYIPAWPGTKKITTIHDVFVLINQDSEFSPESFVKRKQQSYQKIVRNTDAIIAVSESTKKDIVAKLNFPEEKIFVTHLGVDKEYYQRDQEEISRIKNKYNIKSNYLLFVGNVTPRKNTQRIVQAFNISGLAKEYQLVLCGSQSYNSEKTMTEIKNLGLESNVSSLNYVAKEDLPGLYSGATGFVYPTLYEGFGIPPIEAMACETPVLTSNVGAAPEICGDDAILVDPYNIKSIAEGMQNLIHKTDNGIQKAKTRANSYSWKKCAEQTLAAYEQVLKT